MKRALLASLVLGLGLVAVPAPATHDTTPPVRIGAHTSARPSIDALETTVGLPSGGLDAHRLFYQWTNATNTAGAADSLSKGRLVHASFNTRFSDPVIDWHDVAAGQGDTRIIQIAQAWQSLAAQHPGRVLMSFAAEPLFHQRQHPTYCAGTAAGEDTDAAGNAFKAAHDRVETLFDQHAPDVAFVFTAEGGNLTSSTYRNRWVPPEEEFDWIGSDEYGAVNTSSSLHSLQDRLDSLYAAIRANYAPKPVIIPETGVSRDAATQASWLRDAIATIRQYGADHDFPLKAVIWFDSGSNALQGQAAFDAFRRTGCGGWRSAEASNCGSPDVETKEPWTRASSGWSIPKRTVLCSRPGVGSEWGADLDEIEDWMNGHGRAPGGR
jgi:hypothetical protein